MIDPEVAARLRKNRDFAALQSHIMDHMDQLVSVLNVERTDPALIAATTIGRQLAHETLSGILEPFIDARTVRDADGEARDKADDTGLE